MWGGGLSVLAGGLPPAVTGFLRVLVPALLGGRWWPTPVHMPGERGQHDLRAFDVAFGRAISTMWESVMALLCPAKGGVDTVHTYVCLIAVAAAFFGGHDLAWHRPDRLLD